MIARPLLATVLVACSSSAPTETGPAAPVPVRSTPQDATARDATDSAERCLPVLFCGDCPDACTAGTRIAGGSYRVANQEATVRSFCVSSKPKGGAVPSTCTDVFDLHHACKDSCVAPLTIDTTCRFDTQHRCATAPAVERAADASLDVAARCTAIFELVGSLRPGVTGRAASQALGDLRWLAASDDQPITVLGGKIPVQLDLHDSTFVVRCLHSSDWAIYGRISGHGATTLGAFLATGDAQLVELALVDAGGRIEEYTPAGHRTLHM